MKGKQAARVMTAEPSQRRTISGSFRISDRGQEPAPPADGDDLVRFLVLPEDERAQADWEKVNDLRDAVIMFDYFDDGAA
ncbi:MAG TPA: hypothetical protein VJT73_06405 [Polyangiaceae bacterium]|nr:hypothetical protein [Polyangiaceae bacterium]